MQKPKRVYVSVLTFFDTTGFMMPHYIRWKDGRKFKIDAVRDFRPASYFRDGRKSDCYTVIVKGQTRYLFFEKNDGLLPNRFGRWFVMK